MSSRAFHARLAAIGALVICAAQPPPADATPADATPVDTRPADTRPAAVPTPAAPPAPGFRDDTAQRALACTGCHGPEGRAARDGYYPRIAGKPAGYLFNQLVNFRDGRRSYPPMTHLVRNLDDAFLRELAEHFATLDPPHAPAAPPAANAAQLARGRALVFDGDPARGVPACADCHGGRLTGESPAIPGLLGLPRDYLNAQIGAWRIGRRHAQTPDCMADISRRLGADDVAAVTGWLAAQPMPPDPRAQAPRQTALPIPCGGVAGP